MKPTSRPRTPRATQTLARREAIVAAALEVFSEHGFAAARMEDVARRAGVAKGTIYLHFENKEALFEGILRQLIVPVLEHNQTVRPLPGESARAFAARLLVPFAQNIAQGHFARVVRLLIAEGGRFPRLAESHYRLVISPGIEIIRQVARHAASTGELRGDALARFPQLLIAPILVGVIWKGLFERFEPLDAAGMIRAQLDLLFEGQGDA